MRISEFWNRMNERFGATYAASLAADYRLPELGMTIEDAFAAGAEPKNVWRAVCAEFDMPTSLR